LKLAIGYYARKKAELRYLCEFVLQLDQINQGGRSWTVEVEVDVPAAAVAAAAWW
jgi:hypothetical protein